MAHIMEAMIASGMLRPEHAIRVAIRPHDGDGEGEWWAGNLTEWRWVDEASSRWEGLVGRAGVSEPEWVPGHRLVRVGAEPPTWSVRYRAASLAAMA